MYRINGSSLYCSSSLTALYVTNALDADMGKVIVWFINWIICLFTRWSVFLRLVKNKIPFKKVPDEFSDIRIRDEKANYLHFLQHYLLFCYQLF